MMEKMDLTENSNNINEPEIMAASTRPDDVISCSSTAVRGGGLDSYSEQNISEALGGESIATDASVIAANSSFDGAGANNSSDVCEQNCEQNKRSVKSKSLKDRLFGRFKGRKSDESRSAEAIKAGPPPEGPKAGPPPAETPPFDWIESTPPNELNELLRTKQKQEQKQKQKLEQQELLKESQQEPTVLNETNYKTPNGNIQKTMDEINNKNGANVMNRNDFNNKSNELQGIYESIESMSPIEPPAVATGAQKEPGESRGPEEVGGRFKPIGISEKPNETSQEPPREQTNVPIDLTDSPAKQTREIMNQTDNAESFNNNAEMSETAEDNLNVDNQSEESTMDTVNASGKENITSATDKAGAVDATSATSATGATTAAEETITESTAALPNDEGFQMPDNHTTNAAANDETIVALDGQEPAMDEKNIATQPEATSEELATDTLAAQNNSENCESAVEATTTTEVVEAVEVTTATSAVEATTTETVEAVVAVADTPEIEAAAETTAEAESTLVESTAPVEAVSAETTTSATASAPTTSAATPTDEAQSGTRTPRSPQEKSPQDKSPQEKHWIA